jgi:hypothetical protein
LSTIIEEDENLEKHAIEHERGHAKIYQSHSNRIILLILNLCLDYCDWIWFLFHLDLAKQNEKLSAKLPRQRTKDDELYIDIVENFPSSEWFFQKLYEFFKPDVFPFYLLCVCILLFLFKFNNFLIIVFTLCYFLFGYSFLKMIFRKP